MPRFRTIPATEDYAVVVTTDDELPFTIQDVSQCRYPDSRAVAVFSREEATAIVGALGVRMVRPVEAEDVVAPRDRAAYLVEVPDPPPDPRPAPPRSLPEGSDSPSTAPNMRRVVD